MGVSEVRQRDRRSQRAGGSASDLLTSKLRRPPLRPGTVCRSSLVERLARGDPRQIVSVVASAGYGKTTLLSQWAGRNGQTFAWVSVEEGDNDAKVLLRYVAEALDAVEPIDERVFDALASPGSSVPGSVVPRLGSAFSSMTSPVVLVLDDVHVLRNSECRAALSVLADQVAGGSRLVLAGRAEPPLRIARLRAEGKLLEIGPDDLSLTCQETSSLLRNAGVTLGQDDVAELHRRTEGWQAGLYLAALYLREGGPFAGAAVSFGGGDRLVSEYMESEFLARISRRQRTFLTRTAVLERMCGPLCEAVRGFAAGSFVTPAPALLQGIARVLCGDLDSGDLSLEDAVSVGEEADAPDDLAVALCERSLVAMARGQWDRAEGLPGRARTVLRRAGIEESFATPLICALRARAAIRRGDVPAAHRELVSAQHLRPLLTYALPYLAVQARIELARVHLALADPAGARTLMPEVDDLLSAGRASGPSSGRPGHSGPSSPGNAAQTSPERRR